MAKIELVDLESVEIVTEVERAFRIKIGVAEAEACSTVGDVFALVVAKTSTVDQHAVHCPTALAFWRLRSAFHKIAPGKKITPSTPVIDLLPTFGHRLWWQELQQSTGLVMPSTNQNHRGSMLTGHFCSALSSSVVCYFSAEHAFG